MFHIWSDAEPLTVILVLVHVENVSHFTNSIYFKFLHSLSPDRRSCERENKACVSIHHSDADIRSWVLEINSWWC